MNFQRAMFSARTAIYFITGFEFVVQLSNNYVNRTEHGPSSRPRHRNRPKERQFIMLKVSVELSEMLMLVKRKRHATLRASF